MASATSAIEILRAFDASRLSYADAAKQLATNEVCGAADESACAALARSVRRSTSVERLMLASDYAMSLREAGRARLAVLVFAAVAPALRRRRAFEQLAVARLNWANALQSLNQYRRSVEL